MGWSHSEVPEEVWVLFRSYVPADHRKAVARNLIEIFEQLDWDTQDEAEQLWAASEYWTALDEDE